MIYLDSSVALAAIFVEQRKPRAPIWADEIVASRLLEYEIMVRVHARRLETAQINAARALLLGVRLLDLAPQILARALEPFPLPVRTLDALHLATMVFLRSEQQDVALASYDARLRAGAAALGFALAEV